MPDETPSTPDEEPAVEVGPSAERPSEEEPATGYDVATKWRLLSLVLAVALVATLVAGGLLWRDLRGQVQSAEDEEQAETAAEEAAVNAMVRMTTYHHRTVEEDYSWVEELGTSGFEETWRPASKDAIRLIKAVKASAEGSVINSAAESVGEDEVRVLLFTDQELKQRNKKGSDLEETRVEMTMVRGDTGWLVDTVEVQNFFAEGAETQGQGSGAP